MTWSDETPGQKRVRRQGLEPRTRGLRVARWAAAEALPARIAHLDAPEAPDTRASGRCSFHDPFHGPMASTPGCITESHRSSDYNVVGVEKYRGALLARPPARPSGGAVLCWRVW
jgi:hypothetical protein